MHAYLLIKLYCGMEFVVACYGSPHQTWWMVLTLKLRHMLEYDIKCNCFTTYNICTNMFKIYYIILVRILLLFVTSCVWKYTWFQRITLTANIMYVSGSHFLSVRLLWISLELCCNWTLSFDLQVRTQRWR